MLKTPWMTRQAAEEIARSAKLLTHPVRPRLLAGLAAGPGSASQFAAQFGDASVEECSYNLDVLRDRKAIVLQESRQRRGFREKTYRLVPSRRLDAILAALWVWVEGPELARTVIVDDRGVAEIRQALAGTSSAVARIAKESAERIRDAGDTTEQRAVIVRLAAPVAEGGGIS